MNALFLSSLGRTPLEVGLFASVSMAGDIVKAVMPVVIVRAVLLRAWGHGAVAALMLLVAVAVSLASGTGFAALTRGTSTASRQASNDQLAAQQQRLQENELQLSNLNASRAVEIVEADLDGATIDRRWLTSKSCTEITLPATRQFCGDVFRLRAELATAKERSALKAQRETLRADVTALQTSGAGIDSDPQSSAIADLFGVDRKLPRLVLTTSLSVVLELGSVALVLLAAGPALRAWRDPGTEPKPAPMPAEVPLQADRSLWRRQREAAKLPMTSRGGVHAL